MNNRSSSQFILIRMVSVIEKFLLILGRRKGWIVNRRFRSLDNMLTVWGGGEQKKFYLIFLSIVIVQY